MVDGVIQKTEDGGQITSYLAAVFWRPSRMASSSIRAEACVPLRGTFIKGAAVPQMVAVCLLMSVLYPLNAEELPDPTRPPAIIAIPAIAGSGTADNQPAGLRSIIISKTRRAAIIDGETVELGGKHGDARLIEVNEGSVVLKSAQGRQVLTLFPDVKISRKKVKAKPQSLKSKVQPEKQKANQAASKEKNENSVSVF